MTTINLPEVGRALDTLVAEKVMGGKWIRFKDASYPDPDENDKRVHAFLVVKQADIDSFISGNPIHDNYVLDTGECVRDRIYYVPRYSTEIAAAWDIVEKLGLRVGPLSTGVSSPTAWLAGLSSYTFTGVGDELAEAPTAPLAICRAALKAVSP